MVGISSAERYPTCQDIFKMCGDALSEEQLSLLNIPLLIGHVNRTLLIGHCQSLSDWQWDWQYD